jgi:protein-disulfide isomerase
MTSPNAPLLTRRQFAVAVGAASLAGAFAVSGVSTAAAQAAGPTVDQLMAPGALPDLWLGDAKAPITIIEYASMTCGHCATFHNVNFPELKKKYIDTGKARFVLREFPLDPLAAAAFMLARCSGDDKREAVVHLLFGQQKGWIGSDKPVDALAGLMKQTGMSQEKFEACLKDADLYAKVNQVRDRAGKDYKVDSTPTFFINGKRFNGDMTPEQIDKALEPLLPK